MTANWQIFLWKLRVAVPILTGCLVASIGTRTVAQITPDTTLGNEASQVKPIDDKVDRIDGGAVRGSNLFHSFQDFNVGEGRGAYFANPAGIDNILSRVTGNNPSNIFGTLGVLGNANLFLLNPNGIIFGQNAKLDIRGSFVGSTAGGVVFNDRTLFGADKSQTTPLLTMAVPVGLQYGTQQAGNIINSGNLAVGQGQKLALVGGTVTSSGQMTAPGGTVHLLGNRVGLLDRTRVDVSSETGGGTVLIGGDFQGKGEVLNAARTFVSPNATISADALSSGDGGRVIVWADEATGFYGNISARGGRNSGNGGFVEVSGKQNLIFRGNVDASATNGNFGTLLLDPADITISNVGINNDQLIDNQILQGDAGAASFTISAATLQAIPGNVRVILQATNDIKIDSPITFAPRIGTPGNGSITFEANADGIDGGKVVMNAGTSIFTGGRDIEISGASLSLGKIDTSANDTFGGNITLRATNGGITADVLDASNRSPDGVVNRAEIRITSLNGLISLTGRNDKNNSIEGNNIIINTPNTLLIDSALNARNDTLVSAGNVFIGNEGVPPSSITVGGISTRNLGGGDGGNIIIKTTGIFKANSTFNNDSSLSLASQADGKGGLIDINAIGGISILAGIDSSSNVTNGGGVKLFSLGDISTGFISTTAKNNNNFADVSITSRNGSISINGRTPKDDSIFARSITIDAPGSLSISGFLNARTDVLGNIGKVAIGEVLKPASISLAGISTRNGSGNGGEINIATSGLLDVTGATTRENGVTVKDNQPISNSFSIGSEANGNGGDIKIFADGGIRTRAGIVSNSCIVGNNCLLSGNAGRINLTTKNGDINIRAGIIDSSSQRGDAGAVNFDAGGNIIADNVLINASSTFAIGNGGNVEIMANKDILAGSIESTGLLGGNITLNSGVNISVNNNDIATISTGSGIRGQINLTGRQISLKNARIGNLSYGGNDGGNIVVRGSEKVEIASEPGSNSTVTGGTLLFEVLRGIKGAGIITTVLSGNGKSGDINIETPQLSIRKNSLSDSNSLVGIGTLTFPDSIANAGNIKINALEFIDINGNDKNAFSLAPSDNLQTNRDNALGIQRLRTGITSATQGSGNAGQIEIETGRLSIKDGAAITSGVTNERTGQGNNIIINRNFNPNSLVELQNTSAIATASLGGSQSSGGNLTVNASKVNLSNESVIAADTLGAGQGGNLNINTNQLNILSGSRVSAATFAGGQGGNVTINSPQTKAQIVNIDGTLPDGQLPGNGQARSGMFSESRASGGAGDINIFTDTLDIKNRGEVSVKGSETGTSGNLNVTAGSILLTQQARLNATTSFGSGGNINIAVADSINMKNDGNLDFPTEITAQSFGTANGGNITLRVGKWIFANLKENSDIVAEAFGGNGGKIDATAAGSFGFIQHEKGRRLPESEFIASSSLGQNGIVDVNTQDFQPIPIPDVPVVREVPQVCPTAPGVNTRAAGRSAFSNAGRGGLPPNPGDVLESNITEVPWVTLDHQNTRRANISTPATAKKPEVISEAQGWQKLPDGRVKFTTQKSSFSFSSCIVGDKQR